MELKTTILEKITNLYVLLSKVDKYWATINLTKSIKDYNSMRLQIHVYTFLEEDGEKEKRLAYIINEEINLMETTAEQQLDDLLDDVKELISVKKEEAECQTN